MVATRAGRRVASTFQRGNKSRNEVSRPESDDNFCEIGHEGDTWALALGGGEQPAAGGNGRDPQSQRAGGPAIPGPDILRLATRSSQSKFNHYQKTEHYGHYEATYPLTYHLIVAVELGGRKEGDGIRNSVLYFPIPLLSLLPPGNCMR